MFATGQIKEMTPEEKEVLKFTAKKNNFIERPTSSGQNKSGQLGTVISKESMINKDEENN